MSQSVPSTAASRADRSRRTHELLAAAHEASDPQRRAELLDEVVVLNHGVAEAVASRYRGRGVSDEDLNQSAMEGLVKAVHKFDPTVRPDLLTYAVPTILGEIQRWFRDRAWIVRPPRRIQELQWQVSRSVEQLSVGGRAPTDQELSRDLGCTETEMRDTIQAFGCFNPASLDAPVGNGTATLGELIPEQADGLSAAEPRAALATVRPACPNATGWSSTSDSSRTGARARSESGSG